MLRAADEGEDESAARRKKKGRGLFASHRRGQAEINTPLSVTGILPQRNNRKMRGGGAVEPRALPARKMTVLEMWPASSYGSKSRAVKVLVSRRASEGEARVAGAVPSWRQRLAAAAMCVVVRAVRLCEKLRVKRRP